jgi:hypothetical protein
MKRADYVKAATYLFCETCQRSTSGNLYIEIEEVEQYLNNRISEEQFIKICDEVRKNFPLQVLDINENDDEYAWTEGEFNMNIGTDYLLHEEEMNSLSYEEECEDEDI